MSDEISSKPCRKRQQSEVAWKKNLNKKALNEVFCDRTHMLFLQAFFGSFIQVVIIC